MHKAVQFPTGSQITKRGGEEEKGFWCRDEVQFMEGRRGSLKEELLVSVNLVTHTLFKD